MRNTLGKDERLRSRKLIESVVTKGKSIYRDPFRLSWAVVEMEGPYPAQTAFAVPKKNFKRAVDRNRVKRLMREVYRKNKSIIYDALNKKETRCAILILFTGKEMPDYAEVETKLLLTLHRFEKAILGNSG